MFGDVMILLVVGAVIVSPPSGQALTLQEQEANFVELLRKVEVDKCSTLASRRLNAAERADAIIAGNQYCVEMRRLLANSPDYEQGDCMRAAEPSCAEIKESVWGSKKWRCTVKVSGLHYGTNKVTIFSCVESALKEYKRQLKNSYCKSSRYGGGGQNGSGSFRVHYGQPPDRYRPPPSQPAAPPPQSYRRRGGEKSRSPPPSARTYTTTSTTSTTRPHPPMGPPLPVSVSVNPYSGKFGTGTIEERIYEGGQASGTKTSSPTGSQKGWPWKKRSSGKSQKPVALGNNGKGRPGIKING